MKETGARPFMLHLNGDAKFLCPDMYSDAWFATNNRSANRRVDAPKRRTVRVTRYGGGIGASRMVNAETICGNIWEEELLESVRKMRSDIIQRRYHPSQ